MEVWAGVECPIWAVLLPVLAGVVYLYGVWPYKFFSSRGIPGPKPLPFIGNLADMFTKAAHVNETKWTQEYGNIYGIYMGRQPILCVHDAKIVEDIMVKDFAKFCNRENNVPINPPMDKGLIFIQDDHWRQTRNIILPTFSTGKLKRMHHVIQDCGRRLAERFNDAAVKDQEADTRDLFGSYALEVIASTAFGLKVDALADNNDPFLKCVHEIFGMNIPISFLIYKCFPILRGINDYFGFGLWPKKSVKFFDESIREIIAQRIANKQDRLDFLQLLLNAESEDIHNTGVNKKLSLDELSAQSFVFFVAGFETTATLITFACYNLCRHAEIQQRVYEEMVEVLGDEEPSYEKMSQLTYLGQCLNETLRMFPPIQSMSRVAKEDVTLGGYNVPRGTAIHLPFFDIMHNPQIYPDPETFKPDRFAEKRAANKPTFLAFGIGPRMCLGNRLGIIEAKIALCFILRKFFLLPPKSENELKLLPGMLMNPCQKLTVRLKMRDSLP